MEVVVSMAFGYLTAYGAAVDALALEKPFDTPGVPGLYQGFLFIGQHYRLGLPTSACLER